MRILDISHHQENTRQIEWDKIKEPVIMKATQGTGFLDHEFLENREEARKRGLHKGSYHFAGKGFKGDNGLYFVAQDPIQEADWYLQNVGEIKDGEILCLDWEIEHADPVGWCVKFMNRLKEKTGLGWDRIWFYTNDARAVHFNWPKEWTFWVARYGVNDGTKNRTPDFENWYLWQYTSMGLVDGIVGRVDLNTTREPQPDTSIYWQRHPRYKGIKLGKSNLNFQDYGCFVCSLSYCVQKDPLEVNKLLSENGGMTTTGLVITPKAYEILGLTYVKTERDINNMPSQTPTIKEVSLGRSQHFTVRLIRDGKRLIFDPWLGKELPINHYSFRSYRIFETK